MEKVLQELFLDAILWVPISFKQYQNISGSGTSYDKVKELTSFQNSNMYLHKPAQSCFLGPFLRIWEKAVCFLGYLLRIWEESMKISNP